MTPPRATSDPQSCHYVTLSDLSDMAGGRLVVYCHPCERHIERDDDLVFEEDWDETFVRMVMGHHGFDVDERESVWFIAALGDWDAARALLTELQRSSCPDQPAVCTHW